MKKIKILLFVTVIVLSISISGCDMLLGGEMPNYDDLEDFENGDNGGGDNDSGTTDNDGTAEHVCDFVAVSYVESTCSAAGKDTYKCSCGKTKEEPRDLAPHTEQIIPATEATDNSPATTAGVRCSACGYIIVQPDVVFSSDFTTPDRYDGSYAYNYLSTLKNGENLTKLYNSIDIVADYFHISGKDASDGLVVSEINFSQYGLTSEEALAVWSAYVIDHPLYYWMSKNITYMSTALSIKVDEDYMSGAVRNEYNAKIYAKAEAFIKEINSDSKYLIAMMLHDLIISSGDYAYEADGVTPKDDVYAHNILGILEMGEGVCESYAKSFQMMLNYCGVENVMVSGYAGEAHAWNLVKLDDEKW